MKHKRFYAGFTIPLAVAGLYFAFSARLLQASGEYLSMDAVVERITRTGGYYGPALTQRTFYFKKSLYEKTRPDVAATGSSRALLFRKEAFSAPFVNMGGLGGLNDVEEMIRDVIAVHPPRLLILGVDFWWFHPSAEGKDRKRDSETAAMTLSDMLKPAAWLASGKLSPGEALTVSGGGLRDAGFSAILRRDGFDGGGAYHYTSIYTGAQPGDDVKFGDTLARVKAGTGPFVHGESVSDLRWRRLESLVAFLKEKNIKTILYVPPMAPAVEQAMRAAHPDYFYVDGVRIRLARRSKDWGLPLFDYHDNRRLNLPDCAFKDGFHGGEIAYDRMLLDMAAENGDLRALLDLPALGWRIDRHPARASTHPDETDFLELGCDKTPKNP